MTPLTTLTAQPVVSSTPSPTLTNILQPVASSTFSSIPTVYPTLTLNEQIGFFRRLFESNESCQLPCFWGIYPGETSENDLHKDLLSFGEFWAFAEDDFTRYDFLIYVPEEFDLNRTGYAFAKFYVREGVVQKIWIAGEWITQTPENLVATSLDRFGIPEEVWIMLFNDPLATAYFTYLLYPHQGILIQFSSDMDATNGNAVVCPQDIHGANGSLPGFILFPTSDSIFFESLEPSFGTKGYLQLKELVPQMDEEKFYHTYIDHKSTECINIPLGTSP